jgi:hypothetical protein
LPQSGSGWQPSASNQPSSGGGLRLQNVAQPGSAQSSAQPSQPRQGDLITVPLEARRSTASSSSVAEAFPPNRTAPAATGSAGPANSISGTTAPALDTAASAFDAARRVASNVYEQGKAAALANRERIIRVLEPRQKPDGAPAATGAGTSGMGSNPPEPRKLSLPGTKPVNIMDLPEINRSGAVTAPSGKPQQREIRLTSATEELSERQRVLPVVSQEELSAAEVAPRARYGHDPAYCWLIGRLEYSQADRRWKLRYIPIDGTTDEFGGSVMLADTPLLSGYERGDFVEIHGRPLASQTDAKTFAAAYEISQIRHLGD